MEKYGPYMTHILEWYGKVGWRYGTYIGFNFATINFNVWKMYGKKSWCYQLLWESYGNTISICIPYQHHICLLYIFSGNDTGCLLFNISWHHFFKSHRLPIWLLNKIQSVWLSLIIKAPKETGSHRKLWDQSKTFVEIWINRPLVGLKRPTSFQRTKHVRKVS